VFFQELSTLNANIILQRKTLPFTQGISCLNN